MTEKLGLVQKMAIRLDGWANALTGLGMLNKDKRMSSEINYSLMSEVDAEMLYAGDGMAAKIVDLLPRDALRKGFEITGLEDEALEKLQAEMLKLDVMGNLAKSWRWARLYGGSGLFIATGEDISKPAKYTFPVKGLTVLNRWELNPTHESIQRDISMPGFGMPTQYNFQPKQTAKQSAILIDGSHLIRWDGVELPEILKIQNQRWGDSVLNRLKNAIANYATSQDSAALIIQDFRMAVFKLKNLADQIASGNGDAVVERLKLIDLSKSIARAIVIDGEGEDFDYKTSSLAGLPEILDRIANRLVSETDAPHTILLGQSPTGSNSTGNSTTLSWYDLVASEQKIYLKPKALALIKRIALGMGMREEALAEMDLEFNSLWEMDEKEKSTIRKAQAETDQIYHDLGVYSAEEIAKNRFGSGKYSAETTLDMDSREMPEMESEDPEMKPEMDA